MIKFIKNLFSSETEKVNWKNHGINLLEEESKYKPRLKKTLGKWYVTNMEDGVFYKT